MATVSLVASGSGAPGAFRVRFTGEGGGADWTVLSVPGAEAAVAPLGEDCTGAGVGAGSQ